MAKRVWLGHAPDVAQIDVFEFDEDECTILAERSHLEFVVNDKLLTVVDARTTADILIGAIESRHIHAYMQQQQLSSQQHRDFIHAMLDVVFPGR